MTTMVDMTRMLMNFSFQAFSSSPSHISPGPSPGSRSEVRNPKRLRFNREDLFQGVDVVSFSSSLLARKSHMKSKTERAILGLFENSSSYLIFLNKAIQ